MTKNELAEYLVSLHTLLNAQESMGAVDKSRTLAEEYDYYWKELKRLIQEEKDAR